MTNRTINIQARVALGDMHHPAEMDRIGGQLGVRHRQSTNIGGRTSLSNIA